MALVNDAKKEIHAKIVYFGPGESGKTTNLEYIYNKLKPEYRGKFKFMNTSSGRLVFFDFMRPELAGIGDYSVRFHIYTAPGNSVDSGVWKNALKGADGIVFVADASPSSFQLNKDSLDTLKACLSSLDMEPGAVPCIFQYNKTDLAGAVPEEQMRMLLDTGDDRVIPSSAATGKGVLMTLSEMVKMVLRKLQESMGEAQEEPGEAAAAVEPAAPVEPLESAGAAGAGELPEAAEFSSAAELPEAEQLAAYADLHVAAGPDATPAGEPGGDPDLMSREAGEELPELEPLAEEGGEAPDRDIPEPLSFDTAGELPAEEPGEAHAEEPREEQRMSGGMDAGQIPDPRIQVAGDIQKLGYGRFRLPLVIRFGNSEKKTALTIDLSFD